MKNVLKLLGIIAFAAVIGFSLAACTVKLEGSTWVQSDGKDDCTIIFDSPPNMTFKDGSSSARGTYSVSGKKVTITADEETLIGKISGNKILFSEEGDDEVYTFTKESQSNSKQSGGSNTLADTIWIESDGKDDVVLVFGRPPEMAVFDGSNGQDGTYTVSGNKVTITVEEETGTGTISGNVLTINFDGEKVTFKKQDDTAPAATTQNNSKQSGSGQNVSLEGTWTSNEGLYLDFDGPFFRSTNVIFGGAGYDYYGNYTISGKKVTITFPSPEAGPPLTGTISGNVLKLAVYGTFTKQ